MPILANRPAPRLSGKRNFCKPSDRKTAPTSKRTRTTEAGASVVRSLRNNDMADLRSTALELRGELVEVVDLQLLLDGGHLAHHLLEALLTEQLVFLLLELLAQL